MQGSGFDRIARAYRWLEYLCLGRSLERCRALQLAQLAGAKRVLILGDGDGRFTAALLACHLQVQVVALDSSAAMLALLTARVRAVGAGSRLTVVHREALCLLENEASASSSFLQGAPPSEYERGKDHKDDDSPSCLAESGFDSICSHFFLDCLSTPEVLRLVAAVCPRLEPGAHWIVSEFAAPSWWTRLIVTALYRAFRLLTGLRVQHLPQWREALTASHFVPIAEQRRLGGLLTSSVWLWKGNAPDPASTDEAASLG